MTGVSAILLAAGESQRMGRTNKLTLPIRRVPLLRHVALTLLSANLEEIVVVVGHEARTARMLLADLPLEVVTNPRYQEGQMTSVECGMQELRQPCAGVMVCLSDQPLLEIADINTLITAFQYHCPTSVLVPTYQGRRGNPVILSSRHHKSILDGKRNLGCRNFIENNPELVCPWEMDKDHVVFDLDTPEDFNRLRHRLGQTEIEPDGSHTTEGAVTPWQKKSSM
jgi:molybdenum cofactor cytidylyltransferase